MRTPRKRIANRKGGALIEFAISFPLLLVVIFGAIEICERIFFKQSVTLVAYEGARLAARRSATSNQVLQRCQQMLKERRIEGGEVLLSPSVIDDVPTTTPITITVRATRSTFGYGTFSSDTNSFRQSEGTAIGSATMLRE